MSGFAYIAAALVVAWAALVITAQLQNPDQSPLSMGMSGLARGRSPWAMKSSFIVRGLSALVLVASMPGELRGERFQPCAWQASGKWLSPIAALKRLRISSP